MSWPTRSCLAEAVRQMHTQMLWKTSQGEPGGWPLRGRGLALRGGAGPSGQGGAGNTAVSAHIPPLLSPAGSHWLGFWPAAEGGAPGGHQPDGGGPLTCHVLLPCRSPCARPQHRPVLAAGLPPTPPAPWPAPTRRVTRAALHCAGRGHSPGPISLASPKISLNAFPEGKFCLNIFPLELDSDGVKGHPPSLLFWNTSKEAGVLSSYYLGVNCMFRLAVSVGTGSPERQTVAPAGLPGLGHPGRHTFPEKEQKPGG